MKKFKPSVVVALATVVSLFSISSCSEQSLTPNPISEVSDEVKDKFTQLGFNVSDIKQSQNKNPFLKEPGVNYILEGDITIPSHQLDEMLKSELSHVGPNAEQYRTSNLVSPGSTINVLGYTGGSFALTSKMQTGLQRAVDNYNAVSGMNLNFTLSFGTNYSIYDIVVYKVTESGAGGVAGFPSGGAPYKWVQIFSPTDNFSTDVNEHVITHEIGHAIGFRHTDWFSRESCGGSGEAAGSDGAIHIPGTPSTSNLDWDSIMIACFSGTEDGELSSLDKTALSTIY